ncbi:hypothetical protein [Sphingomonas sp.]|uniref:hypothetical protein n=1 Tax=Sphingomonas sp. TaxID=28214 RepID=UPI002D809E6A|nr:hypothetical protein [Sphingomonas sp.]HEU0045079.1 hypothetical protein [Sphingomonas sp.]
MTAPANPIKGEVKLGNHTLLFDFNALCAVEEAFGGRSLADVLGGMGDGNVSLRTFRTLVWAGLQAHHEGTSEQVAGNIIDDIGGPQAAADALTVAFGAAMPEASGEARPPQAGKATGSPSSPRGAKKA